MKRTEPKVSVIIPCFNAAQYIDQCITSVLQQTLQDIEVICVDDGSTDNTVAILREYAAKDSRLQILCQKNLFAGVARNTGMAAATGEYFAFLDADDYYEPDGLEKAYAIAKANDVDLLKLSSYLLDNLTGEITTTTFYSHSKFTSKNRILSFRDCPKELLNCSDVAWNALYKREFLTEKQIRFNNFCCVNDTSFFVDCLINAGRIMVADVYLTCYRQNIPGSLVSIRYKHFENQINAYHLIKQKISAAHLSDDERKLILQYPLSSIFIWYNKALKQGVNVYWIEEHIRNFLLDFDEEDVGTDYLNHFVWKYDYARFKKSLKIDWQTEKASVEPKISVITTVYNGIPYLSECIESLLLQSMTDFELICINDGSTDATRELLDCMAQRDKRIRIFSQENTGIGQARNEALQKVRGTYVTFLDADDVLLENHLLNMYNAAETHSADVVVSSLIQWISRDIQRPENNGFAKSKIPHNAVFSKKDVPAFILSFTDGRVCCKMFRHTFIRKHNFRFPALRTSDDFLFTWSAIMQADRICYVPEGSYLYRQFNSNSLEKTKDNAPLVFWDATLLFKEYLQNAGLLETYKRAYLINTLRRIFYNLHSINTLKGFSAIFYKLKEIQFTELELDQHNRPYYIELQKYDFITTLLKYDTPEEFLLHEYRKTKTALADKDFIYNKSLTNCDFLEKALFEAKERSAKLEAELAEVKQENERLKASFSFRIGRLITWLPRKICSFVQKMKAV